MILRPEVLREASTFALWRNSSRLLDNVSQVHTQPVCEAQSDFKRRSPQPALKIANHLLGNTTTLFDRVFGQSPTLAFGVKQADDPFAQLCIRSVILHAHEIMRGFD